MGFGSMVGSCFSFLGTLVTDKRRRLSFFLLLCSVLEIATAVVAAVEGTKLNAFSNFLQSEAGATPSDSQVLLLTLLVCNCSAEVCLIIIHMVYGVWFLFLKTCCARSLATVSSFGVLVTMTFYTAILSLALAGPSQISDSYFKGIGQITGGSSGFSWSHDTDYPTYASTYGLFYACGSVQLLLSIALYLGKDVLIEFEIKELPPAFRGTTPAAAPTEAPVVQEMEDEEKGRGMFFRMRGKGVAAPAPALPAAAAAAAAAAPRGIDMPAIPTRSPPPGAPNPYDASVASSIASNPWGAPDPSTTRSQQLYGQRGAGW